jgi:hypothetical protein
MTAPDLPLLLDPDSVVERARALWRAARTRVEGSRFDLFLKIAMRTRAERGLAGAGASISATQESGLAMRMVRPGQTLATFAACSGLSDESLAWVLGAVTRDRAGSPSDMPEPGSIGEPRREDLDRDGPLPQGEELEAWLADRERAAWVEIGTTVEAIVGDEGWVAVRKRHRGWAMAATAAGGRRLFAARGLRPPCVADWEPEPEGRGPESRSTSSTLIFSPPAAAALVVALTRELQTGDPPAAGRQVGSGWCVADEPGHPEGLAGGAFDDAGFEAGRSILTDGRQIVGVLPRGGTMRRSSFRDAPESSASTLVVFPGAPITTARSSQVITRCRVLPLSAAEWVLSLASDAGLGRRAVARIAPDALVRACSGTLGRPIVCADGVITPGLMFQGIEILQ